MILPPPPDLEAFHRGEPVRVRVRMEPQPEPEPDGFYDFGERGWAAHSRSGKVGCFTPQFVQHPLGPPGTRHGVRVHVRPYEVAGMIFPAASMYYGCTTVTPEPPERDADGWWWVATVRKETA